MEFIMVNVRSLFSQSILIETIVRRTLLYNFMQKIEIWKRDSIPSADLFDYNCDIGNITTDFQTTWHAAGMVSRYSKHHPIYEKTGDEEDKQAEGGKIAAEDGRCR
ncbi:hypothetical protein L5D93_10135 [Paenibacillus thiaminolyticus]|nr:hypothetical protein [Paenibacillus thiaminolyticus]